MKNSLNYKIVARGFLNNIVWIIFLLLMITFSATIYGFFSVANYINIIYHSVFIGILAIGQTFVLISGNLDLSVESTAAGSAILSVWLVSTSQYASGYQLYTWVGFLAVIILGVLVGAFNAFFVVKLKINSFLVTLSSYIFVRAAAIWITGGYGMQGLPNGFRFIDMTRLINIPLMVYLMFAMFIFFEFLLKRTRFGRHVYIVWGNESAAHSFGINVDKLIFKVFILSGVIASLAGWLMAARANGSVAAMGRGYLFEVLAAVVIGGVSLQGGIGSLVGAFAGALILSCIHSALNLSAVSPFITNFIQGILIIVAVSLDALKRLFR